MERYASLVKDFASRSKVSRAMTMEIRRKRNSKFIGKAFEYILKEPIPVLPTVQYNMGEVIISDKPSGQFTANKMYSDRVLRGSYAAGEAGCASLHGVNRSEVKFPFKCSRIRSSLCLTHCGNY
uniref:Succinate dehydrogenase flavoprotein subunit putativ n=1 Tax=Albugo laibachii Nc14 TaxID=890382 RepID=F0WTL6_9STRA|nr:succinate dehydrogenase flavoprotein subunit putativ [Albugo laibachii Nc14]|eukprot:CCA24707.1 succinate dehydrogenase flavoprotein subunit putativ [Albugo laibachii Nc14]